MTTLSVLRAASPRPYWLDRDDVAAPVPRPAIGESTDVELLVVGGGLTGLWAGFEAARDGHDVIVVDGGSIGSGASGRCGGFINASITHGIPHGHARWPRDMATIVALQRALWDDMVRLVGDDDVIEPVGKFTVATRPHHVDSLARTVELLRSYGEDVTAHDCGEIRDQLGSTTYLAGYHLRSANGLCDPARLAWRLAELAESAGTRVAEYSQVSGLRRRGGKVHATFASGAVVRARKVLLCTNASPPLLRRLRAFVAPVYDHVIVTEPLSDQQWQAIGWRKRVGITDAGNQFHYYRPTPDGRILFGGWEATYHFGGRVDERYERDAAVHALLYRHLVDTFPALESVAVTHAWGGAVDSTSRFTPTIRTAAGGQIGWAIGFTGLGVGASRFGALAALDLLFGRRTERTELPMVRRQPIPFPPEPLRWAVIQFTKRALVREDVTGRRSLWLRALDRLGVGFDT
jgi:glycine/D-amino acid oxidase-like deaminating enzyme